MNLLFEDIYIVIDKFLTNKDTLNLTSTNKDFRHLNSMRYKAIIRALVQKQYQEGIRDGFTLLLDNLNPVNLPENNITGFFMDDPLQSNDPWYNSAMKMNDIVSKITIIGSRYR